MIVWKTAGKCRLGWSMKSRNRRTARSAKFTARLAGLAVLALVASGCSGAEPGVVAYVGDTKITQRQLDEAFDGVTATLPDQQIPSAAVADALIQGAIADRIAAANKIVITDSDRDALLKGSNLAPLIDDPRAKVVAYDAVDPELVARQARRRRLRGGPHQGAGDPQSTLRRHSTPIRRRSSATSPVRSPDRSLRRLSSDEQASGCGPDTRRASSNDSSR